MRRAQDSFKTTIARAAITCMSLLASAAIAPSLANAYNTSGVGPYADSARKISMGDSFTCTIVATDDVRCWGFGANGQLGLGSTSSLGDNELPSTSPPVDLGTGRDAIEVAAGTYHACAILDNGDVRCWGFAADGQLGYGNTDNIGDDEAPSAAGPVNLGPGRTATQITAGEAHTCAILDNASVRCWGNGMFGQHGLGNTNSYGDDELPSSAPVVNVGGASAVVEVTAGAYHTCALSW